MKKELKKAHLTGAEAEIFVEKISKESFLAPWVFLNPQFVDNNNELIDVAIYFRNVLILIEVKDIQFDPEHPQRYLKEIKRAHRQLVGAKNTVESQLKIVRFENDYHSFETNFEDIDEVYLICMSAGQGEMEMAFSDGNIDSDTLKFEEISHYLGFYNSLDDIHNFTIAEFEFANKHIDTIKDFLWYLQFENLFFKNNFDTYKEGQTIFGVVDAHREDLISIFVLKYYGDTDLNRTGKVDINKLLTRDPEDLEKIDMIVYFGSETQHSLDKSDLYNNYIIPQKEVSYLWDDLVKWMLSNLSDLYSIDKNNKVSSNFLEIKEIFEEMSFTSRLDRFEMVELMKDTETNGYDFRIICSLAEYCKCIYIYSVISYDNVPSHFEMEEKKLQIAYTAWCRIKYGKNAKIYKNKIEKVIIITKHLCMGTHTYSFSLQEEMNIDEKLCRVLIK